MSQPDQAHHAQVAIPTGVIGNEPHDTRLHGTWLVAVRAIVFAAIGSTIGLYLLAFPGLMPRLATPCADPSNSCIISPEQVAPLAKLGITPNALALAVAVLSYLTILLVSGVAAVLIWRRSDDWMALLVALTLVLMPVNFTPVGMGLGSIAQPIGQLYSIAGFVTIYLLVAIFPSGRFVPRWLWLPTVVPVLIASGLLGNLLPDAITLATILISFLCLIVGQIYRYRRISTPVQRQQTKWAVYGLVLTLVVNQAYWQPAAWIPALQRPDSLFPLLAGPDSFLMIVILAVCFGIAILRYRLYDIDVIVNRALVYGSLTVVLALVYVAGVVGLQAMVNGLTQSHGSENSPLVIVITTLAIAALFQPLRRRIQSVIDRRFYRRKYDARQTLERFSATLRQEVELAALSESLVQVVEETMQPEHASLWLQPVRRNDLAQPQP
ncbi:MAG: hypothetical protein OJF49_000656 [Ktedonobacterales bacterium]|jgi:hypothetical protein|nr:MAG: hypothetical protein OJF49_000656 [Ktedonobacterales bacterium]